MRTSGNSTWGAPSSGASKAAHVPASSSPIATQSTPTGRQSHPDIFILSTIKATLFAELQDRQMDRGGEIYKRLFATEQLRMSLVNQETPEGERFLMTQLFTA